MKWRIAQRKLIFVNRIMAKPVNNITRKVLMQETIYRIKGLATETRILCLSLGLPSVMATECRKAVNQKTEWTSTLTKHSISKDCPYPIVECISGIDLGVLHWLK